MLSPIYPLGNYIEISRLFITAIFIISIQNFFPNSNFQVTDRHDNTPLHYAALYGNLSMVQFLWMNGADINCENALKMSPLHFAVNNRQLKIVSFLISNGANLRKFSADGVLIFIFIFLLFSFWLLIVWQNLIRFFQIL